MIQLLGKFISDSDMACQSTFSITMVSNLSLAQSDFSILRISIFGSGRCSCAVDQNLFGLHLNYRCGCIITMQM